MRSLRRILLLIGLLFILACGLVILAGYRDLAEAGSVSSAHDRSRDYESAAQHLPWAVDLYQLAGSAALQAGEYERAIILFQTARRKAALTPDGQFELGKAWFLSGDREKALAEWRALPNGTRATVNAAPYLVDAYHARAQFDDEERVLRQWLALDSKNADAQYRLGLLLFADAAPEAIPLFESAASSSPELKPGADGLRVALKTALEDTSPSLSAGTSPAVRLTDCGRTLAAIGEWPLALRTFSRATQADAKDALAWAWLAEARQQTGGSGALDALQRAVSLAPDSAQIHAMFALYWQRQHDWQKVRAEYESAARLEPQNAFWQVSLGDAWVHLGDLVKALTYYQNAVSLSPGDAQTWRALAQFSVENDVDVDGIGRDAALRAYALDSENAQGLDILGRALLATQQYDAAETFFKKALAAAPKDAAPAYHLAVLYLQTDKLALAKQYLLSAQSLDPNGTVGGQASMLLKRYFP
ncbi:MAG: tetratricopeptide repeat protein [Anaerolineales bacterium]